MKKTLVTRKVFSLVFVALFLVVSTFGNTVVSQQQTVTVIVRGETMTAVEEAVGQAHGYVTRQIGIIDAVVAEIPESQLTDLKDIPGIVQVTRDRQVELTGVDGKRRKKNRLKTKAMPKKALKKKPGPAVTLKNRTDLLKKKTKNLQSNLTKTNKPGRG